MGTLYYASKIDALPKLAKALGVSIEDLIVGPGTKLNSFNKRRPAEKVKRAFDRGQCVVRGDSPATFGA